MIQCLKMKQPVYTSLIIAIAAFLLPSCHNKAFNFIAKKSAWEAYSDKLNNSGLAETVSGRLWFEAASEALQNPPELPIPFTTKGVFRSREITALAWQFEASRGSTISMALDWNAMQNSRVFIDLFENTPERNRLTSFSSSDSIHEYEFRKSGSFILRIQPELLSEGSFVLTVKRKPTYAVFPVYGKDSRAVQSFWAAPRGGGSRKHEGIDIFAPRGTPVVAPVSGIVSAVRNRGLGGKQVWLRDNERGFNLYFAHLDSQAVSFGTRVKPGDTLGFVGNTGNAKFTPPHLHFGIYAGGAFNPYPMVENRLQEPAPTNLELDAPVLVVNSSRANFRKGPGTTFPILNDFDRDVPLFVLSTTEDWYLVESPTGQRGYIHSSLLKEPDHSNLETDSSYVFPDPFARPLDSLLMPTGGFVNIGEYQNFQMIADSLYNVYFMSN